MMSVLAGLLKLLGLCFFMVTGCVVCRPIASSLSECEEDHNCSENEFCYGKKSCVECYNCTAYYRRPHQWKVCAKEPTECGDCLPGYKAEILTNGRERDYCIATEKSDIMLSGSVQSPDYLIPLIIGASLTITVVVVTVFLIRRWRKRRFGNDGDQSVQSIQNHSHGSGNGLSPLLGGTPARKTAIEDWTSSCEKPAAPPPCEQPPSAPPPPYEGHIPPAIIDQIPAPVVEKLCERANFRDHGYQFPRLPSDDEHEEDEQSDAESDTANHFGSEFLMEYLNADLPPPDEQEHEQQIGENDFDSDFLVDYHNADTLGVSDTFDENSELEGVPESLNTEGPSFLGVLSNNGISALDTEAHEESDSGVSQTLSNESIVSAEVASTDECERLEVKRQRLESGCYDRSKVQGDNNCKSEDSTLKRAGESTQQTRTPVVLDHELFTFHGAIPNLKDSSGQSVPNQDDDSGVSQASSSKSIYLSTVELRDETELPPTKRQKLNSSTNRSEKFNGGDSVNSPDNPEMTPHIIDVNEPNNA